jgi:hypothetical protein
MQVCHGKCAPLWRLRAGDGIVYYSPTVSLGGDDRLQALTSIADNNKLMTTSLGGRKCRFDRNLWS